jgi:hypothetical protein
VDDFLSALSNRERALLIWLAVFVVFVAANRSTRQALGSVLKALASPRLATALLAICAYVTLVVFAAHRVHLWQWWMLKDTLFWFFGAAVVMFFNTDKARTDEHYFRNVVVENLKFAVVLDFILNLYVFNLVIELLLLPVLALLAMLTVVAGTDEKYAQLKKLLQWLAGLIGLGFLLYALASIVSDFRAFTTVRNLQDFALPIGLTVAFLPFTYALGLYSAYELLFVRMYFLLGKDPGLVRFARWQVAKACLFRLSQVRRFSNDYSAKLMTNRSRANVSGLVAAYKSGTDVSDAG